MDVTSLVSLVASTDKQIQRIVKIEKVKIPIF